MTTSEAAKLLDVPADRISSWKRRNLVQPVGMIVGASRAGGQPIYDLDDLRPLAERYHQWQATHRDADG